MRLKVYVFGLFASVMLVGCAYPRLTRSQVIGIAQRAAGVKDPAKYEKPVARYWLIPEKRSWQVFFHLRDPIPDADFSVLVDDRTGEAKVRGMP